MGFCRIAAAVKGGSGPVPAGRAKRGVVGRDAAGSENFRKFLLITLDNFALLPRTESIMTMQNDETMSAIGADLLSHAQEFGEPNRLPLITQLFPFLFPASRRLTTREMSAWLEKEKGVKLSGPMISKGLQRPELHLRRIAEHVQPLAAYIAAAHGLNAEGLLFGEDPVTGESGLDHFGENLDAASEQFSDGVHEAYDILAESWKPIPEEVKFMCRRYFNFAESAASDESDDEASQPQDTEP